MSVEFHRESPGKFDSGTLNRETLNRWTGRIQGRGGATSSERLQLNEESGWSLREDRTTPKTTTPE